MIKEEIIEEEYLMRRSDLFSQTVKIIQMHIFTFVNKRMELLEALPSPAFLLQLQKCCLPKFHGNLR